MIVKKSVEFPNGAGDRSGAASRTAVGGSSRQRTGSTVGLSGSRFARRPAAPLQLLGRATLAVMADTVSYELDEHVATITYNRAEALNAINAELREDLNAAFARFRDEQEAWVGIVTGQGRAFYTGADLKPGAEAAGVFAGSSGRSRRSTPSRAAGRSSNR